MSHTGIINWKPAPVCRVTVFSEALIDAAYHWLCQRRAHFPANADIWHLRFHWGKMRAELLRQLADESYRLSPLSAVVTAPGKIVQLWSSIDALVLKVLAQLLPAHLPLHPAYTHVKGHDGLKGAVRSLQRALPAFTFVPKPDVKRFYAPIDHHRRLNQLGGVLMHPFLYTNCCASLYGARSNMSACTGTSNAASPGAVP
jgi:RNA-directed DNA polymerase